MSLKNLNFQRAEYGSATAPLAPCAFCGRSLSGEFYRTNGDLTCGICVQHIRSLLPKDDSKTFWRSAGLGAAAALAASLIYLLLYRAMMAHGLGMATAFGAIGAGYLIGKAMSLAGPNARGRRYQITAALLTYAAITIALTTAMFGTLGLPGWSYFVFPLGPFFLMFVGQFKLGLFQLFFAGIGIRWTWTLLAPHAVKITGPEQLPTPNNTAT